MNSPSRIYLLWLLTSLYLAQGVPYGFFTTALPVLMREEGLSLKAISATSLLFVPWALKFAWAPIVDHYGTRRQWLIPLQIAAAIGAGLLAFADLADGYRVIFAALFVFNVLAAVQDIATDGLAVRMLDTAQRGLANGIQVGAYRIGMILGGGLLLFVFAKAGWSVMFGGMALILVLTCLPVFWLREPAPARAAPVRRVWLEWATRLRLPGVGLFVLLICLYKFGDSMAATLVGPYLSDAGLSKEHIALLKGAIGSIMGLAGAALGGWVAFRFGRRKALLGCGLLQAGSLALYVAAAAGNGQVELIYAATIAEHLLGGMATVALFTLMMDASDREHAGTDYTLYACAIVIATGISSFAGAALADAFGYTALFGIATLVSLLGCLALVRAIDRGAGPQRLAVVWPTRQTQPAVRVR